MWEQDLHPHHTELNHTLLTLGCLTIMVPVAFFAALGSGNRCTDRRPRERCSARTVLEDEQGASHHYFGCKDSHLRFCLDSLPDSDLIVNYRYICSRIFLHAPPGEDNALQVHPGVPEEIKKREWHLAHAEPKVNPWVCTFF